MRAFVTCCPADEIYLFGFSRGAYVSNGLSTLHTYNTVDAERFSANYEMIPILMWGSNFIGVLNFTLADRSRHKTFQRETFQWIERFFQAI